jgi:hypothetical protein
MLEDHPDLVNEAEEGEILDDIIEESTPNEFGPALKDKVNIVLKNFMGGDQVLKDTTAKLTNVLIPQGSEFMSKTRVNDSVYPLLNSQLRRDNAELVKVESAMCKSAIVQSKLMDKLLELRNLLPAGQAGLVKDLVKDLALSLEIQGFGRIKLNELRRETIVRTLNPEFKRVLTTTSPGDGWLFGKDLSDSLKDIKHANKLSARLNANTVRSKKQNIYQDNFLGRGQASRGRDRTRRFQRTYARRDRDYWKRGRSPSPQRKDPINKRHR